MIILSRGGAERGIHAGQHGWRWGRACRVAGRLRGGEGGREGEGNPGCPGGYEGSAASAGAAAGKLRVMLWLGQRHTYDWGCRWERRRRLRGGD